MVAHFLIFGGDEIEKKKFHSSKSPIATNDIDINEIVISDASAYGKNKDDATFFMDTQMIKKLGYSASSSQKECMKPNACLLTSKIIKF